MENKLKHLEFIQNTISRMAGNLFFLRGWTITVIAALLGLFSNNNSPNYIFYFLIVVMLIFWFLDGYFLSQERLYRDLYNHVRTLKNEEIDFSMDITQYKQKYKNTWFGAMFSLTLCIFYISLLLATIILIQIK